MATAMAQVCAIDANTMVFGDLYLEDVRAYREARLQGTGEAPLFPLWRTPTAKMAQDILAAGVVADVVTCDPKALPASGAGRRYDAAFLADLPEGVDPCGERGEFHTAVTDGAIFASPIPERPGETVLRDGYVYADLIPAWNAQSRGSANSREFPAGSRK